VLDVLVEASCESYVSAFDIAIVQAALGETDTALDWLDRRTMSARIISPTSG